MKDPEMVLKKWLQAVNTMRIENLLSLYNETAILIPTFSNRLLHSPDTLREYFERLSSRKSLSVTLRDRTLIVQSLHNDIVSMSGIYNWRFEVDGELLNFEARFSYILDLSKSSPIIHHHSSQIPRTL
ncbi:MAG: nuclear transport factor 2 family protein [Azonexus sp.]